MEQQLQQVQTRTYTALVIFGYLFCILSFLMLPIIFMPLAIIFGILCIIYNNPINGSMIIVMAVLLGCLGAHMGGWGFYLPRI